MNILSITTIPTALLATVLVCLAVITPASAAPQLLAVATTPVPQPLHCFEGVCAADFSSFCLQKQRSNPDPGTAYTSYASESFMLVYTDREGVKQRISARDRIKITSKRGFTAIKAEMDESVLDELGTDSVAIIVSEGVTLIPVPVAGDTDPITDQEIDVAVNTLRPMADEWLGGMKEKSQTIGLVNTLINQTPLQGRLSSSNRVGLWNQTLDRVATYNTKAGNMPNEAAIKRAQDMYDACLWRVEIGRYFSMRDCLGIKHDSLLQDMNLSYWKATGAGS